MVTVILLISYILICPVTVVEAVVVTEVVSPGSGILLTSVIVVV